MATRSELEQALLNAYKRRYGEDSIIRLQYNGPTEPNGIYHHWQLWYKDENGVIRCNHDIYAISFDGKNFEWYNRDPTKLPTKPPASFQDSLLNALSSKVETGEILYFEIINSNDKIKKGRVFIKFANGDEGIYICSFDSENNLVFEKVSVNI